MKDFIAKFKRNGIEQTIRFNGNRFDKSKAETLLKQNDIQNFWFLFDEKEFINLPDGSLLISGEIGWDITLEKLIPHFTAGKNIFHFMKNVK